MPERADEPPFNSHDVVIISDGPDGHVWHCYTCDVAGWYDAGTDTGAHGDTTDEYEPPFITCEGSGAESPGWCPMCAIPVPRGATIPDHYRLDVLAMIDRGDFDAR